MSHQTGSLLIMFAELDNSRAICRDAFGIGTDPFDDRSRLIGDSTQARRIWAAVKFFAINAPAQIHEVRRGNGTRMKDLKGQRLGASNWPSAWRIERQPDAFCQWRFEDSVARGAQGRDRSSADISYILMVTAVRATRQGVSTRVQAVGLRTAISDAREKLSSANCRKGRPEIRRALMVLNIRREHVVFLRCCGG